MWKAQVKRPRVLWQRRRRCAGHRRDNGGHWQHRGPRLGKQPDRSRSWALKISAAADAGSETAALSPGNQRGACVRAESPSRPLGVISTPASAPSSLHRTHPRHLIEPAQRIIASVSPVTQQSHVARAEGSAIPAVQRSGDLHWRSVQHGGNHPFGQRAGNAPWNWAEFAPTDRPDVRFCEVVTPAPPPEYPPIRSPRAPPPVLA